jgi:2-(1,2-epoxy-1,2-dihydrophenyl)acetyl-CoA isomerase
VIGYARSVEWLTSGRRLGAEEALAIGLVGQVVEPDELLPKAKDLASRLAAWPGEGVGATKRLLQESLSSSLQSQLERELQVQAYSASTPAYIEAMEVFLNRS